MNKCFIKAISISLMMPTLLSVAWSSNEVLLETKRQEARRFALGAVDATDRQDRIMNLSELSRLGLVYGLQDAAVCKNVRRFLDDPEPTVRTEAAHALANLRDEGSAERFKELALKDPHQSARITALFGVQKTRGLAARDLFNALLEDKDPVIQMAAVMTLADLGDNSVSDRALAGLKSANVGVTEFAGVALGLLAKPEFIRPIQEALEASRLSRQAGYEALLNIELARLTTTEEKLAHLEKALVDLRPDWRAETVGILLTMRENPKAKALLIDAARNPKHPEHHTARKVVLYYELVDPKTMLRE